MILNFNFHCTFQHKPSFLAHVIACFRVYPINLLREIETRAWLLAVESEAQVKSDGDFTSTAASRDPVIGNTSNIIEKTANLITKMDVHINKMSRATDKHDAKESTSGFQKNQVFDASNPTAGVSTKTKRRAKAFLPSRRPFMDSIDRSNDSEDVTIPLTSKNDLQLQDENLKLEISLSKWEERVGPAELERAVLSLLEFGQITAAKQLQHKLSPENSPPEFVLVDAALKLAATSTPHHKVSPSMLDEEVHSVVQSYNIFTDQHMIDPLEVAPISHAVSTIFFNLLILPKHVLSISIGFSNNIFFFFIFFQVLESLANMFTEGSGRGLCKRIIAFVKAANVLGLSFSEAFEKQPIELLQLLSLKAQESFEEASLLVQTHSMSAASIAQILAESFLKVDILLGNFMLIAYFLVN